MADETAGQTTDEPVDDALIDDQADAAEDFLNDVLEALDIEGEAVADVDEDGSIFVDISGEDMAVLIGRHGATLDALQALARGAVAHATQSHARLVVDIEGYRDRQIERLERDARAAAKRVAADGIEEELEPMTSFERKMVHDALKDFDGVITESEGEGPDRRIVIKPA